MVCYFLKYKRTQSISVIRKDTDIDALEEEFKATDPKFLSFLKSMLNIDENKRKSASELLKHEFIKEGVRAIEIQKHGWEIEQLQRYIKEQDTKHEDNINELKARHVKELNELKAKCNANLEQKSSEIAEVRQQMTELKSVLMTEMMEMLMKFEKESKHMFNLMQANYEATQKQLEQKDKELAKVTEAQVEFRTDLTQKSKQLHQIGASQETLKTWMEQKDAEAVQKTSRFEEKMEEVQNKLTSEVKQLANQVQVENDKTIGLKEEIHQMKKVLCDPIKEAQIKG